MRTISDIAEEYEFLEGDERYRLLIELGRDLEEMPGALKTDATLVRGCSAQVWVYPTGDEGKLHFLADSNAAITKGIVALVLVSVATLAIGTYGLRFSRTTSDFMVASRTVRPRDTRATKMPTKGDQAIHQAQ